jgi:hypothetical protein
MKRFILLLCVFAFPLMASAQLNVTNKVEKSVKICHSYTMMGNAELFKSADFYYIYMKSTNQFDDVELMFVGDSKESALQTLRDLESLFESTPKGDLVYITDYANHEISLYKSFKKQFSVSFKYQTGTRCLGLDNVKAFITALEKE